MKDTNPSGSSLWGSLSLRLGIVFVVLLLGVATAIGYLFHLDRAEVLSQRDRAQLRFQGEVVAGTVELRLRQLLGDLQFLAQTLPISAISPAVTAAGPGALEMSGPTQGTERLQRILLDLATSRPSYREVRILLAGDGFPELVGIERGPQGPVVTHSLDLVGLTPGLDSQAVAHGPSIAFSFGQASGDEKRSQSADPARLSLVATAPLRDPAGRVRGLLFLRADPELIAGAGSIDGAGGSLWIMDEHGQPLFESVSSPLGDRKATIIPSALDPIAGMGTQGGAFLELPGAHGARLAYVTERPWGPRDPSRRLIFVLAQPDVESGAWLGGMRRGSLIGVVVLLASATLLVGLLIRRQTRSLSALAAAADALARGDFQVDLPAADAGEVGSLVRAFRHMVAEVGRRESELAALNQELERRVEDRAGALAREHALGRLILDSVADGVVVADRKGHFVLWNRKAEQIIGAGPESVPMERWSQHFGVFRDESGAPFPSEQLPLARAINGESIDNLELYLRHPSRAEGRWAQVTARPIRDQDGVLSGAVAVMVDVTERRRLQVRLEAHRAELAKFGRLYLGAEIASAAAHQLSQPLAALCNYAGAALRMHQQGRLGESDLGEMLARIGQLSVQAGDALDRLRAHIRRSETTPSLIDVDAVVTSCLDFLGERIQREGVHLERRGVAGLPPVLGDPLELEHALIQLVVNALEAMEGLEQRQRHLIVGMRHDPIAGRVTIEIADTGRGVRPELAERIFRPWETDKPGALGIGLSIVQTIIESLGGRIKMEPGVSRGTCFCIELPVAAGRQA